MITQIIACNHCGSQNIASRMARLPTASRNTSAMIAPGKAARIPAALLTPIRHKNPRRSYPLLDSFGVAAIVTTGVIHEGLNEGSRAYGCLRERSCGAPGADAEGPRPGQRGALAVC